MADDANVKGDSEQNPPASSAEQKTPEEQTEKLVSQDGKNQQRTSDMPEWDSLKGSTQDRIKQLIQERDDSKRKYEEALLNKANDSFNQSQDSNKEVEQTSAEFQQAVKNLEKVGKFVTEEKLQQLLQPKLDRLTLDRAHDKLEDKYQGSTTLPKYIREEVEDYAKKKGIWDLDVAFKDMYHDEFLDYEIAQRSGEVKKTPYTEKPKTSSATKEEPMNLDYIKKKLAGPKAEAMSFYEKYKDTIEEVIKQSPQTE